MTSHESSHPHAASISAITEQNRSAEFKDARGRLIDTVNDWLRYQSELRDAGTQFADEPLVTQELIYKMSRSMNSVAETRKEGVALLGNGIDSPFVYQKVRRDPHTGTSEIIEVRGTDPMDFGLYGEAYSVDRQSETIVSFGSREIAPDGTEQHFSFHVMGDGKVKQGHVSPDARHVNITTVLNTEEQLATALLAFQSIAQSAAE